MTGPTSHRSDEQRAGTTRRVKDARVKLTSQSLDPVTFKYELLVLFARNQLAVGMALPLFAIVLVGTAFIWVEVSKLSFWLAAVFICQGSMMWLCERFERLGEEDVSLAIWGRRFALMEGISGLAWASLVLVAWAEDSTTGQVFLFAITIIMIAVRVTLASQALTLVYAGTLPLAAALVARLLVAGEPLHLALAAVAVTTELYFVWLARRLNQTSLQMIAFRAEKDALISELEEARSKADEARRRAEDANLAKSRFLATMSHELRTPLNAILGFSEVMKEELMGEHTVPTYQEYSTDIHKSGEHLLNLINEILDLSRIEAGRYDLNATSLSVAALGEECRKLLHIRARKKMVAVDQEMATDLPMLLADERAIRQIWLNLLSNAIKFTPTGGTVTLRAWRQDNGGIAFSVRDTGPGIAQEEIPRILSAFGQGAIARRHAEEGAGLGLPIVKGLAELHGGRLDVRSRLRQGTEMIVSFPPGRSLDLKDRAEAAA